MPKATSSVTAANAVAPAYEEAMAELEALVERMESGGLPLDQLLSGYQRGADVYLTKPAKPAEVTQVIQNLCRC